MRPDKALRVDQNGMSECQLYEYRPQPDAPAERVTKARDGQWYTRGGMRGGRKVLVGRREAYHDFSF